MECVHASTERGFAEKKDGSKGTVFPPSHSLAPRPPNLLPPPKVFPRFRVTKHGAGACPPFEPIFHSAPGVAMEADPFPKETNRLDVDPKSDTLWHKGILDESPDASPFIGCTGKVSICGASKSRIKKVSIVWMFNAPHREKYRARLGVGPRIDDYFFLLCLDHPFTFHIHHRTYV